MTSQEEVTFHRPEFFEGNNRCVGKGDPFNITYFYSRKAYNEVCLSDIFKEAKKFCDMRGGTYMYTALIKR